MTTATCRGCGERIGLTTTATDPMTRRWLHEGWQHEYDHLPEPALVSSPGITDGQTDA